MAILVGFLILLFSPQMVWAQFLPVAHVISVEGEALLNKESAKVGMEVSQGMTISAVGRNFDSTSITFKLQNGHVFRIHGGTVLIKELHPKMAFLSLINGSLYSVIAPLKGGDKVMINVQNEGDEISLFQGQYLISKRDDKIILFSKKGLLDLKLNQLNYEIKNESAGEINSQNKFSRLNNHMPAASEKIIKYLNSQSENDKRK